MDLSGTASCRTLQMGKTVKLFYMAVVIVTLHGEICNAQSLPPSICNRGFQHATAAFISFERYNFLSLPAPPTAPAEAPSNKPGKIQQKGTAQPKRVPIILGVIAILFLAMLLCCITTWRRLKTLIFQRGYKGCIFHEKVEEDTPITEDRQIVFKMETLLAATENFHGDNKHREGGFGSVYKRPRFEHINRLHQS